MGACLAAAWAGVRVASRAGGRRGAVSLALAAGVILGAMSWRTVGRNPDWRDNLTLALHDVRVQPRSAKLHAGAGIALADAGEKERAETHLKRAVEIYPDYAQSHYNLGILLAARGAGGEAIPHLMRAAELSPANPLPFKSLAPLLERAGRRDDALVAYGRGSELDPADLPFRFNHGRALLAAGRIESARAVLERLARDDEGGLTGTLALALSRETVGDAAGARALYRSLLERSALPPAIRRNVEARLASLPSGEAGPDAGGARR